MRLPITRSSSTASSSALRPTLRLGLLAAARFAFLAIEEISLWVGQRGPHRVGERLAGALVLQAGEADIDQSRAVVRVAHLLEYVPGLLPELRIVERARRIAVGGRDAFAVHGAFGGHLD